MGGLNYQDPQAAPAPDQQQQLQPEVQPEAQPPAQAEVVDPPAQDCQQVPQEVPQQVPHQAPQEVPAEGKAPAEGIPVAAEKKSKVPYKTLTGAALAGAVPLVYSTVGN